MKVLVIGYGNPLREDDGVGWVAAEAVGNAVTMFPGTQIDVETVHQLLPELADPISLADLVIFIDAAVSGKPGEILQHVVMPQGEKPGAFSHQVGPAGLLESARVLYGRFPPAYLFTITAAQMGYSETLSPAVAAALPHLFAHIDALIRSMGD